MNRYKIHFNIVADIPDEREQLDLGGYTAIVEAETAGDAERKALDDLIQANLGTSHHYLFDRIWDLGPVENEEGALE